MNIYSIVEEVFKMLKSYKTVIYPNKRQIEMIHQTIGTCRYMYNFYLSHNQDIYKKEKKFVSGNEFSKWINNEYVKNNPKIFIHIPPFIL